MRVLVVEDDLRTASLLRRGLAEEGYAVDVASDGPQAVWRAAEFSYDAVVLDVMLPGMDGFEVCRKIRAGGCWAPVLMLTARGAVADRIRGLDAGADDYLAKPFNFADTMNGLLDRLQRALTRQRDFVADASHELLTPLTALRAELELSPREFALLELLARHPGQVLSRTRILEHVWDFAFEGLSNVVDQYIGYLRRKIDRPFGLQQLETVRGVGYRLRATGQPVRK